MPFASYSTSQVEPSFFSTECVGVFYSNQYFAQIFGITIPQRQTFVANMKIK